MRKKEILLQAEIAYQEKILELLGLKIGDTVDCSFTVNTGNAKRCFLATKDGKGIIVKTEKGIFVKSIDKYKKAHEERVYTYRPSPTYWKFEEQHIFAKLDFIIIKDKEGGNNE